MAEETETGDGTDNVSTDAAVMDPTLAERVSTENMRLLESIEVQLTVEVVRQK